MNKAEVIVEGRGGVLFDSLEDAMQAAREMHREGAAVHIEVFPDVVPGQIITWRYAGDSDEWFMVPLAVV